MSAQIIAALRRRADELVDKSTASRWRGIDLPEGSQLIFRIIAAEFRALADEAEGVSTDAGVLRHRIR